MSNVSDISSFAETAAETQLQATDVGTGVFAARSFQHHDVIGWIEGQVFDDPDYSSDYCIDLEGTLSLEPDAPFRFLNHCCDPNCEFAWDEVDSESGEIPSVYIYALRDIAAGEQLTIDYNWPAQGAIPCRCEAENCRQWIVSLDELHLVRS